MSHDVFVSYASADKPVAVSVCAALERSGVRCWIAPRDVQPGLSYAEALIDGINRSRVMVLVFSSHTSGSPHVMREIERAVSKSIPVVPLRIERAAPSMDLEYFISSTHWLDALEGPLDDHLNRLSENVKFLLKSRPAKTDLDATATSEIRAIDDAPTPPKPVAPKAATTQPAPVKPVTAQPVPARSGRWILWSAIAVVILALGLGVFWVWRSRQHPAPPVVTEVLSPPQQMAHLLDTLSASKIPEASDPKASEEVLPQVKSLRLALGEHWLEAATSNPSEVQQRKKILTQSGDYLNSLQKVMEHHPDVEREAGLALARLGELQFSESQPNLSDPSGAQSSFQAAATHLGKIAEVSPADALVASNLRMVQQRLTAIETPSATDSTPDTGNGKPDTAVPAPVKKAVEKKPPEKPAPVVAAKTPPPVQVTPEPVAPPPPPANPQSGVLHYSGPPVPFNGTVEFDNLPGERLKFNFDTSLWQLLIEKQPDGRKKLILRSKKQGVQTTCDGTWEIVK